jgi:branched-chain amino acid transport system ATP-binding protein
MSDTGSATQSWTDGATNGAGRNILLDVKGLTAGYNGRPVIYDIDIEVPRGEIVVILGSNGAGKSTLLKSIVGLVRPDAAAVTYAGKPWRTDAPWRAAGSGMAFIPAERFTFAELTVDENLSLGSYTVGESAAKAERLEQVLEMFPILAKRRAQKAGTMSGGEQRMLSLAVALMSGPELLLLDEPSLGLAPAVVQSIMTTLSELVAAGKLSVLMVEQNVGQVLHIAHDTYVMRSGRIILHEPASAMLARQQWWDLF